MYIYIYVHMHFYVYLYMYAYTHIRPNNPKTLPAKKTILVPCEVGCHKMVLGMKGVCDTVLDAQNIVQIYIYVYMYMYMHESGLTYIHAYIYIQITTYPYVYIYASAPLAVLEGLVARRSTEGAAEAMAVPLCQKPHRVKTDTWA